MTVKTILLSILLLFMISGNAIAQDKGLENNHYQTYLKINQCAGYAAGVSALIKATDIELSEQALDVGTVILLMADDYSERFISLSKKERNDLFERETKKIAKKSKKIKGLDNRLDFLTDGLQECKPFLTKINLKLYGKGKRI